MYDAKYTNHKEIMLRLSRIHKHKEFDETDVLEWCAECCIEYIRDYSYYKIYNMQRLDVVNNTVKVPCYLYKINDLYSDINNVNSVVRYIHDGSYLYLDNTYKKDYVYINYWGLPIDEKTKTPLILQGHEQACMAFCVKNIYYEDFLNNKIDANRWQFIINDFEGHLATAKNSYKYIDNEGLREQNIIQGNMIVKLTSRTPEHLI